MTPPVHTPSPASAPPTQDGGLREATAVDLDALVKMELTCFADDPWTRGMLSEELSRAGGIFIVEGPAAEPSAFAIGWNVLGELHVLQVAVSPTLRRQGAGRRLMAELERRARGAEAAWLEVRADNEPAIGLYTGIGYAPVGRRPRYYGDGGDAVVLRKTLSYQLPAPKR